MIAFFAVFALVALGYGAVALAILLYGPETTIHCKEESEKSEANEKSTMG